ncbi:MAG: Queuine tRNA-ribosyltransferase [Parcubacteria group bacterium GW2011_GWC2_42_12]|nr:MAG: Queuine tRNA-ribosyltransferase [Parcubacteria group bacterium GW2011_GWC2_42_12]KKT45201.1 MAG: Queuine tRNA-ribosyltransferase [Parcubacteria group bacterium GW2011_GWA2_44_15]
MTDIMFKIIKKSKISQARLGLIETKHGRIATPVFMPDATRGVIKHLSSSELAELKLECFVANALHLFLRPGIKLIKLAGGLHDFMNWQQPILSDSGGYQIFSLIHKNKSGASGQITDQGAVFRSPLDGAKLKLTPEQSIRIQFDLGVDLMVCFDDCPPNNYDDADLARAVELTIKWAKRCFREFHKQIKSRALKGRRPLLIAVIQGGNNLPLREYCAKELIKIGFDGFGFGARHVDETGTFLAETLKLTADQIPESKLRFGLGIGLPLDIIRSIKMGWDMFDCVIPTRDGRHGKLFLQNRPLTSKPNNFYETVNITNAKFAKDFSPINGQSKLPELRTYSKAYLHYLFKINEPLAARLASLNNLEFYIKMLSEIRELIKKNRF